MFSARAKACAAALAATMVPAVAVALPAAHEQSVEIRSVAVNSSPDGAALDIAVSHPLTPQLKIVEQPLRLVIDLPDARLTTPQRKIRFQNAQIKSVRLNQYQSSPAIARIVVDLVERVRYSSAMNGNQLHILLKPEQPRSPTKPSGAMPPSVPGFSTGVQPAIVPLTVGNSGTLVEAGSRVAAGSSITAGQEIALLRLARGGEVRVCPGTTVSISASSNGQDLMLGMSQGSIETHYVLENSVDSVLTPDFRIVLPGPGAFNLAVRADTHGNTCVGSMAGSTSSAVVAELIGNGTYELKPQQEVVFRQGRLDATETPVVPCGCPSPQQPVLQASTANSAATADPGQQRLELQNSANSSAASGPPSVASGTGVGPESQPTADANSGHMTVSVESPLVFSGLERAKTRPAVLPAPVPEATALPTSSRLTTPLPTLIVLPPADGSTRPRKNLLGRVKGFFGAIFR